MFVLSETGLINHIHENRALSTKEVLEKSETWNFLIVPTRPNKFLVVIEKIRLNLEVNLV